MKIAKKSKSSSGASNGESSVAITVKKTASNIRRSSMQAVRMLPLLLGCSVSCAQQWDSDSVKIGADGNLCEILHRRLNNVSSTCASFVIETYPGFSDPPWQGLNPREHIELIVKLLKYSQEGVGSYFAGSAQESESNSGARESYKAQAEDMIARGGELDVWRTHLVSWFNAGTRPAPPGEQTIVRMTIKLGTAVPLDQCPGKQSQYQMRRTFIVLSDLSGPDPKVDQGTAARLSTTWPVFYKGMPMLINSHSVGYPDNGICQYNHHPAKTKGRSIRPVRKDK